MIAQAIARCRDLGLEGAVELHISGGTMPNARHAGEPIRLQGFKLTSATEITAFIEDTLSDGDRRRLRVRSSVTAKSTDRHGPIHIRAQRSKDGTISLRLRLLTPSNTACALRPTMVR